MDKKPKPQSKAMEEQIIKGAIRFINAEADDISYPGRLKDNYKKRDIKKR